jgi:CheY-like chemotaxis protein
VNGEEIRVLVVDDKTLNRNLATSILRKAGYSVDADLHMPVFDGAELIEYVANARQEMLKRIIITTAYPTTAAELRSRVFGVLHQPFQTNQLLQMVQRCTAPNKPPSS